MSEFSDIFCLVPNEKPDYDRSDLFWTYEMTVYIIYRVIMNIRSILLIFS